MFSTNPVDYEYSYLTETSSLWSPGTQNQQIIPIRSGHDIIDYRLICTKTKAACERTKKMSRKWTWKKEEEEDDEEGKDEDEKRRRSWIW